MSRTASLIVLLLSAAGVIVRAEAAVPGDGKNYPSHQLRLVIPFAPGGGSDIVGRIIAQGLRESIGQTVIVDNRGGVDGILGADLVAKAPPDGYTLLSTNISFAVNATLYSRLPYDTLKALVPISIYGREAYVLIIHSGVKAKTVRDLLNLARVTPGGLIYGSTGIGGGPHLAVEVLKLATRTAMTHVPYRGGEYALNGIAGGKMEMGILPQSAALPYVRAGKVTALAVTSTQRSQLFPQVPTMIEAGVADYEFSAWYVLLAPGKTPKPIIARLNGEMERIAGRTNVKAQFAAMGVERTHTTPEQALAYVQSEIERWGKVIKAAGVQADFVTQSKAKAVLATRSDQPRVSQNFPSRELRLVVPFPPGGANDILGKIMAKKLQELLGRAVVIDNRGGAGGTAGTAIVARALPDGHTLLINNISLAINATLFPKLSYDTLKDLVPVSIIGHQSNVVLIGPGVKAITVRELLDLARVKPGALIYGSGGPGSSSHLAVERLQLATRTTMTHVPYKGLGPAMADLVARKNDLIIATVSTALPVVKAGKVRALAVTALKRSTFFPNLPTMIEAGVPDFEVSTWYSVLTPARTSRAIVARLNSELARITASANAKQQFAAEGLETSHTTPEQAFAYIKSEIEKWSRVVKASGAKPN